MGRWGSGLSAVRQRAAHAASGSLAARGMTRVHEPTRRTTPWWWARRHRNGRVTDGRSLFSIGIGLGHAPN